MRSRNESGKCDSRLMDWDSPNSMIDLLFDEILGAPQTESLVLGLYEHAVPAIIRALEHLIAKTNRLFDHPTYRLCRFALLEIQDVQEYGDEVIACLVKEASEKNLRLVYRAETHFGRRRRPRRDHGAFWETVERFFSAHPYKYDGGVRRDERFKDSYNMGVHAEMMLLNPDVEPLPKTVMLYFMRLRELDVPEVMSSIIAETDGKPWKYYRDMTRQLWDEARHTMMGEIGFVSLQIDWTQIPVNFTWSLSLTQNLLPKNVMLFYTRPSKALWRKKMGNNMNGRSRWQHRIS